MKWCEVIGTEPYLCFNFGTGTLDEGNSYSSIINPEKFIDCSISSCLGRVLQWYWEYILREPSPEEWSRGAIQRKYQT